MSFVATGFFVSVGVLLFLSILFRYEAKRGVRFFEGIRTHIDFAVLKVSHALHRVTRFFGRDLIRQIFHYVFHTFLRAILLFVKKSEHGLRNVMRVNKTLAKNAERESASLSKLEEIALHKVSSALTEEEKRKHKAKVLSGK